MTTRERILYASRDLFNKNGLANTSVRAICEMVGISAGNFSYHFPDRDEIVVELYQNMLAEIQSSLLEISNKEVNILAYLDAHKIVFGIQSKYKFVFLNLFEVVNGYPQIKENYLKNVLFEREMSRNMFKLYVEAGVIKNDISDAQFERILNVGQMLHNTWLIEAEIEFKGDDKKKMKHYLGICCGLIEPFLTKKSLREYQNYFADMGAQWNRG